MSAPAKETADRAPASFGQRRLWFLNQLRPRDPQYNIHLRLRITGPLAPRTLRHCVAELARRHEVLRTRLVTDGDDLVQVVDPVADVDLTGVDLSRRTGDREEECERVVHEHAARGFDLTAEAPLRVLHVQLDDDTHDVLFTLHHAAVDNTAVRLLEQELIELCSRAAEGAATEPDQPRQPRARYRDFAARQRALLDGPAYEQQLAYWHEELNGAPQGLAWPGRQRPEGSGGRGAHAPFRVPGTAEEGLRTLAKTERTGLFSVLLAAYAAVLGRWTGAQDVPVGVPVAGRPAPEFEPVVGFFGNTLVARVRVEAAMPFRRLVGQVREVLAAAYANQDLPFDALVEELRPERRPNETPFVNTIFAMKRERRTVRSAGLTFTPVPLATDTAKFDLAVLFEARDGVLHGDVEYRTDLFGQDEAQRLADAVTKVLDAVAQAPEQQVGELPLDGLGAGSGRPRDAAAAVRADPQPPSSHASRSDTARVLCEMWQELLGRDSVGTDEDFFALGGHSLLATHVVVRVRERFGVATPLSWCFDTPTVAELAAFVDAERATAVAGEEAR